MHIKTFSLFKLINSSYPGNFKIFRVGVLFIIFLYSYNLSGQILDDSTKQIYGPKTTSYVYEEDFLWNQYLRNETDTSLHIMNASHHIDTTLNNLHNYNYLFDSTNFYQDLGNYITPVRPVFFIHPQNIGKDLGMNSADRYAFNSNTVKYYDSKSPYTSISYLQGSRKQQYIGVEHARSILPNWSAGIFIKRMTSQKLVGAITPTSGFQNLPQAGNWNFSFYTRYYTNNEKYQVMANLTHSHYINNDIGGIDKANYDRDTFSYDAERVFLFNARTIDKRVTYHLFHEVSLDQQKNFQIYHEANFIKRTNRYNDVMINAGDTSIDYNYYNRRPFKSLNDSLVVNDTAGIKTRIFVADTTLFKYTSWVINDRIDFREYNNTVGVKWRWGKFFQSVYYRHRSFTYQQLSYEEDTLPGRQVIPIWNGHDSVPSNKYKEWNPVDRRFTESFVGGRFLLNFNNYSYLKIDGEYLFGGTSSNGLKVLKDYKYNIKFNNRSVEAGFSQSHYSPTLVQTEYRGNVYQWDHTVPGKNTFQQTYSTYAYGSLKFHSKLISLYPRILYNKIDYYIYYDTSATPQQAGNNPPLTFISYELMLKLNLSKLHINLFGKYTSNNGDLVPVLRVPGIYTSNRIYFESYLFKKATLFQLGIDQYWKAGYNANKYMPVTQQFYVNNDRNIKNYVLVDLFLNVQIKNVRAFLKLSHVNQQGPTKGYYITPYYSGMPRTFDIGINWSFYD